MIKRSFNKNIKNLNTFGMKVTASCFVEYDNPDDLLHLPWAELPSPVMPVGEGSNLLFTGDFSGTLLRSRIKGIDVIEDLSDADDVLVRAGAGVKWDDFCNWAAAKELWGPENLSSIPGTVGAAPVQNIGAYGVEAGDIIESVECFDMESKSFVSFGADRCDFGYRDSFFKHNRRYIVLYVVFHLHSDFRPRLEYGNLREQVERNVELAGISVDPYRPVYETRFVPPMPLNPMLVRDTVKIIRENKLPNPDRVGSAGSFFKNPVVSADTFKQVEAVAVDVFGQDAAVPHFDLPGSMVKIPAAWLIESCGLKGAREGGAAVWEKQALVIVNASSKASPSDVLSLEKRIVDAVWERFSIKLQPEVDHI